MPPEESSTEQLEWGAGGSRYQIIPRRESEDAAPKYAALAEGLF